MVAGGVVRRAFPVRDERTPVAEGLTVPSGSSLATATAPGMVALTVRRVFSGVSDWGGAGTREEADAAAAATVSLSGSSVAGTETAPGMVAGAVRRGLPPFESPATMKETKQRHEMEVF
jgi:hypothetical protein